MSDNQHKTSPDEWVDEYGDALYRFALSRLHDPVSAEDAVQDAFLSAWRSRAKFSGKSSELTWLIGILRHKIVDLIRKESRMDTREDIDAADEAFEEQFFDAKGHWRARPPDWQVHPRKLVERSEFRAVLQACISGLPERLRYIFSLREIDDEGSESICKLLGITPTNLWVLLYRARLRLRTCLDINWFDR